MLRDFQKITLGIIVVLQDIFILLLSFFPLNSQIMENETK